MSRIIFTLILIAALAVTTCQAQPKPSKEYPVVGELCPDIKFRNLKYLPGVTSLGDLRGSWVVLDFWLKGCSGCISTFPKLSDLQKQFQDKVRIVLIGSDGRRDRGSDKMYEKFRAKQGLELAVSFDSTLFERFGIKGVPHVVIVNPSGVVHEVVYGDDLNAKSLSALIEGKPHLFTHKTSYHEEKEGKIDNKQMPVSPEESDILTGSFFFLWRKGQPIGMRQRLDELTAQGEVVIRGARLEQLYNYAYVGYADWFTVDALYQKWHRGVILESADQSPLHYDYDSGVGLYNYFLKRKKKRNVKIDELMSVMREDLAEQFGYAVSIEEREMPVWVLTATDEAKKKLPTRYSKYSMSGDHAGLQFQNSSIKSLLVIISDYNYQEPPIRDSTGITSNVDISIDALMNDFEAIKDVLVANGLILTKGTQKMKVIVLREPSVP